PSSSSLVKPSEGFPLASIRLTVSNAPSALIMPLNRCGRYPKRSASATACRRWFVNASFSIESTTPLLAEKTGMRPFQTLRIHAPAAQDVACGATIVAIAATLSGGLHIYLVTRAEFAHDTPLTKAPLPAL